MGDALTARSLYDTDPTFRALVDEWARLRRCPLPLVDRCLDFALETQAECARWAAHAPDRVQYLDDTGGHDGRVRAGPCPNFYAGGARGWYWCPYAGMTHNNEVRPECLRPGVATAAGGEHPTAQSAILWLLDNWRPAPVPA